VITQIDIIEVIAAIDAPFTASVVRGKHTQRKAVLVRLTTDAGLTGWGETFQALAAPQSPLIAVMRDVVAPLALGRNELEIAEFWREARQVGRGYGDLLIRAASAFDMALWDLKGKTLGQSLSTMLGAAPTGSFPAVATAIFYGADAGDLGFRESSVQQQLDAGYSAIKLKVGGLEPHADLRHIERLRAITPDEVMLAVDANSGCLPRTAGMLARGMEDLGIYWFEEPFPTGDTDSYRRLADQTSLVIAGGQDIADAESFAPLLRERSIQLVQPSVAAAGGITGVLRIAELASVFGARYCPTGWGTGLLVAASVHLRNVTRSHPLLPRPDVDWIEYDVSPNPLREGVLRDPIVPVDGMLSVPEGPGLGVEVDVDAVERLTVAHDRIGG
jgi:D-galactarolactone cycloisomerase